MTNALQQIVVSVRRTTKLTVLVPAGLDDGEICRVIEEAWDGDDHFFDERARTISGSTMLILDSDGMENDAMVEEDAAPYTGDIPAWQALPIWCRLSDGGQASDAPIDLQEMAGQANLAHEQELAALDPFKLDKSILVRHLKWMYPGNNPGNWGTHSKKKLAEWYRDYLNKPSIERAKTYPRVGVQA